MTSLDLQKPNLGLNWFFGGKKEEKLFEERDGLT